MEQKSFIQNAQQHVSRVKTWVTVFVQKET